MKIRKATAEDVEAIYELGKSVGEFAVNDETVTFWPKELLTDIITTGSAVVLVAEAATITGFLIVNYNAGFRKALIENIYVHPSWRNQGIGDELLKELFKQLLVMGCKYIAALVPLNAQAAMGLYTKNGFSRGETFVWLDASLDETFKKRTAK